MRESSEEKAKKARIEYTRLRERANSLLGYGPFVDWAGDMMKSVGFFGEGRELTAYQQGYRGKMVQELERLFELADDGGRVMAEIFNAKIKNMKE